MMAFIIQVSKTPCSIITTYRKGKGQESIRSIPWLCMFFLFLNDAQMSVKQNLCKILPFLYDGFKKKKTTNFM